MLKHLMLSALILTGCGSKTTSGKHSTVQWQLPKNQSLAYRVTAEGSAVIDGMKQAAQNVTGYVFVDVGGDGDANIRLETGQPIFGMTSMALEPGASNFFFPLPQSPMSVDPLVQSLTIKGLGTTATQTSPDIAVTETLTRTADDGKTVRLTFDRKGKAVGETPLGLQLEEKGEGTFDVKAGRYQRLERTTIMTTRGDIAGQKIDMAMTVVFTLEFDDERSKARTQETAQLRGPPVSAEELASYLEANPARVEIARTLQQLTGGQPGAVLFFHLRANPLAIWQAAMALPAEGAEAFVSAVSFYIGRGTPLPQPLIDWFASELPRRPVLENAVAHIPDERLREQLVALAAMSDPDKEWVASQAGDSLAAIDAQKAGPKVLLTTDESQFMQVGMALQAEGQDPRGLVAVLIEVLETSKTSSSPPSDLVQMPLGPICVQWLEGLTSRSFGEDVAAWKSFWKANQSKPYCQWMIEAAGQDTPLLVHNALSRLATCGESREVADYLVARVEKDPGDAGHIAALSLAEHKDRRAIPALIDMLAGDNPQFRTMALVALGNFHTTTLGYDPEGDDVSRAVALRRWRAWAK